LYLNLGFSGSTGGVNLTSATYQSVPEYHMLLP
jgi:hypothetical protein